MVRSMFVLLAVLLFVPAYAGDQLRDAERDLDRAIKAPDDKAAVSALQRIVSLNSKDAAKAILKRLKKALQINNKVYWSCVGAVASFTAEDAIDEIGDFVIRRKKDIGKDILFEISNRNHSETLTPLFIKIFDKGSDELQYSILDHIPLVPSREIVPVLIERVDRSKGEMKRRVVKALELVTGKQFGDNTTNWNSWWNANKDKWTPPERKKSRPGEVITTGIDPTRRDELRTDIPKDKIVVLVGYCRDRKRWDHTYDHIEEILKKMGIPHTVVVKDEFEKESFSLDGRIALIANCTYINQHCICPSCKASGVKSGARVVT